MSRTPDQVAAALLRHPEVAFEVAPLLAKVAGPWLEVDGGSERKDPFGKLVAKVYDHARTHENPVKPWKWVVWLLPHAEGWATIQAQAQDEADAHLLQIGWNLV